MEEIIQIKCPFDGAVLSVRNQPGIESKSVTCPICRNKYPFTQFKRINGSIDSGNDARLGNYPGLGQSASGNEDAYATQLPKMNFTLGRLRERQSGICHQLQLERNIIGRKGAQSLSTIQLMPVSGHAMSREHVVIEVKKVPGKGFVHYLTLFKEKVNRTYINGEPLLYGDCIILTHGDIIMLPDMELIFELPDEEATSL